MFIITIMHYRIIKRYSIRLKAQAIAVALLLVSTVVFGQKISLQDGWKFKPGDNEQWISSKFDDAGWKPIKVTQSWEAQGYDNLDGFGIYRIHVVIPSSLRDKAAFKDSVVFDLGTGDDGFAVYLNGTLISKNYKDDIKTGFYGTCRGVIAANDPAVLWDKDNVVAVRIFDHGGLGGIYDDATRFGISMVNNLDYIQFNTGAGFDYGLTGALKKNLLLQTDSRYSYSGNVKVTVTDPASGNVVYNKINRAAFAAGHPFNWALNMLPLQQKSYLFTYTYTDKLSGKSISVSEQSPYLLTPVLSNKPRINGPTIYGERPGKPFMYKIPATGLKPLVFRAEGLPEGLVLDPATGIITGSVNQEGKYTTTVTVSNGLGKASKQFIIKIGETIGLTPALGWNSWNAFGLSVNEARVKGAAKMIAEKLSGHGWNYVNVDDSWEAPQRAANGAIVTNTKFPDIKALADYVHSLGLKFGIYSSPGPLTCGGYLGSYQHENQDAQTYADWGVDYLKYDWCSYWDIVPKNPSLEEYKKPYQVMKSALDKVNRDILYSFCQYGMGDSWKWATETGGNSWRTTGDITDTWKSMSDIGFHQQAAAPYAGPGHFNDPDMLVVGKVGWGDNLHNTRLTPDEQYTHISLWSLLASPLLIGCDLEHIDKFTLNLLTNDEVIAINQDALGKEAIEVQNKDGYLVYVKDLEDGGKAVGIFNTSDTFKTVTVNWADLGVNGYRELKDVWRQKTLKADQKQYQVGIAAHGVQLVRLK